MKPVFSDPENERKISEQGFIVLDMLTIEEIETFRQFYFSTRPASIGEEFHSTHYLDSPAYKKAVYDYSEELFRAKFSELFIGYHQVFSNFMVKPPGANSRMPLHADWTYVDEEKFRSVAVWCPLVDTDDLNGKLGIIPFSHTWLTNKRGPNILSPFHQHNEYIIEHKGELLDVKAGQAVIYDLRLLHYSPPNMSGAERPAINIVLTPEEAELHHYCKFGEEIYHYRPENEVFYFDYTHFQKPRSSDPVEIYRDPEILVDKKAIEELCGTSGNKPGLINYLHAFFEKLMT